MGRRGTFPLVALAVLAALAPAPAQARRRGGGPTQGIVVLDGERVPVRWTDGDTFRIGGGRFAGRAARLAGVNALETYGPVHRIGTSSAAALQRLALESAPLLAAREWRCDGDGTSGGYGRLLVSCPQAAEALVAAGHAMVFAVDAPADAGLLVSQRRAQASRAGLWAGGVPATIPTGLHSADEPGLGPRGAYDRVVDTRTGAAEARPHARRYAPCEEVCEGEGAGKACMTYVPFDRRYRNRPSCLRRPP
jgi:endonuclease YncB( thermonuclease family)